MSVTNFADAVSAQSTASKVSKIDPVSLPGFGPSKQDAFDPSRYRVRYSKIDLDDAGSIAELEILETRALRNEGIYVLTKDKMNFMDKVFIVISYLEAEPRG